MLPGWAISTMLPQGPPLPALVTTPAAVAYTGAPVGAAKSTPLCGMTTWSTGCIRCGLKRDAMRASGTGERHPPWYGCRPFASHQPRWPRGGGVRRGRDVLHRVEGRPARERSGAPLVGRHDAQASPRADVGQLRVAL